MCGVNAIPMVWEHLLPCTISWNTLNDMHMWNSCTIFVCRYVLCVSVYACTHSLNFRRNRDKMDMVWVNWEVNTHRWLAIPFVFYIVTNFLVRMGWLTCHALTLNFYRHAIKFVPHTVDRFYIRAFSPIKMARSVDIYRSFVWHMIIRITLLLVILPSLLTLSALSLFFLLLNLFIFKYIPRPFAAKKAIYLIHFLWYIFYYLVYLNMKIANKLLL